MTYFCPALDPPLDGSGRKTTTLVRDLEYFIHTKFHQIPSSGSGEEVENVNSLTDDGRTTDAGQRVITIGHWSLWLLCPKKFRITYYIFFVHTSLNSRSFSGSKETFKTTSVGIRKHVYKFPGGFDSYFRNSKKSCFLQNFEKGKTF